MADDRLTIVDSNDALTIETSFDDRRMRDMNEELTITITLEDA
jgi:hypothetical protein